MGGYGQFRGEWVKGTSVVCYSVVIHQWPSTTSMVEKNRGEYKLKFSRDTSSTLIMKIEA